MLWGKILNILKDPKLKPVCLQSKKIIAENIYDNMYYVFYFRQFYL